MSDLFSIHDFFRFGFSTEWLLFGNTAVRFLINYNFVFKRKKIPVINARLIIAQVHFAIVDIGYGQE